MKSYEILRILAVPVLPALPGRVLVDLRRLVREHRGRERPKLLDIGGRSSPYTTGLSARVTLLDVPRESEVQESLALGLSDEVLARIEQRRSNIEAVRVEDMCRTALPDHSFDGAVAVEVLEHVEDDAGFVAQAARVLRPDGWFYATTPNGEWVKFEDNTNPDHLRHYTRAELETLLRRSFDEVQVVYGIKTGKHRARGLRSFSARHPVRTAVAMVSNLVSHWESRARDEIPRRSAHLVAVARRPRHST